MTTKHRNKSLTTAAIAYQREAHTERRCKSNPVLAPVWDRAAEALLALPPDPDVGPGGEVVNEQPPPEGNELERTHDASCKRANIRDTLRDGATRIAEDASVHRTDLLRQPSFDVLALAIDTADSINAGNSVEKMLPHQMALAHEAAMRMMDRALSYEHQNAGDQIEACRCTNAAARLMSGAPGAASGKRRACAIAQQPLTSGTVSGLDGRVGRPTDACGAHLHSRAIRRHPYARLPDALAPLR